MSLSCFEKYWSSQTHGQHRNPSCFIALGKVTGRHCSVLKAKSKLKNVIQPAKLAAFTAPVLPAGKANAVQSHVKLLLKADWLFERMCKTPE